jgi:hypothetical protein
LRYVLIKDQENCDYQRGEWSLPVSITIPLTVSPIPAPVPAPGTANLPKATSNGLVAIEITEIQAKGLYSRTLFGISNPYVACTVKQTREKTTVLSHTNDPKWVGETIAFQNISLATDSLHLEIFDKELISRKSLLGEVSIPLSELRFSEEIKNWMSLSGGSSEESDCVSQIHLTIRVRQQRREETRGRKAQSDTTASTGFYDSSSASPSPSPSPSDLKYYQLNPPRSGDGSTAKAFLYPVFSNSRDLVIGYLTPLKFVLVDQTSAPAEWIHVQCHYSATAANDGQMTLLSKSSPLWGWCLSTQEHHSYFTLVSEEYQYEESQRSADQQQSSSQPEVGASTSGGVVSDDEEDSDDGDGGIPVPVWYQLRDESTGYYYYYNEVTGESEWEPPAEWIEEQDPISGSRYYARLNPEDGTVLETTWSKPGYFIRLIRDDRS